MRDARSGGGKSKPHLISEHGAGQQANKKPRTISQQLSHYSSSQRKYDSPQAERKRRQAQARLTSPKNIEQTLRHVPSFSSAVDSLGQNTIGLGMVRPSRMPGNLLHNLGLGAHGLPTDKKPAGWFKRPLTTDEFHRYQKTGVPPLDAISAEPVIGMVPFVPGAGWAAKAARKELEASPIRNAFHANIEKTVPDAGIAKGLKKAYDTQVLRASKNHGIGPNEYLKRVHEQQPEAVQKAQAGLASAPAAYRATKPVRSEELGKRVEKMGAAMAKGTGSEAIRAGLRELKGPLPIAEFHGLHHMTDAEMETLAEHIRVSDKLTELEKGTAWKSIQDARNTRKPPPPHAQKILERAFGPEVSRELFHPSNFKGHLKHVVIETVNVPRAVMSSADLSAPARQGLVGLISHPVISSKELGPMVKAFGSEAHYKDFFEHVAKDPYYERALKDRLPITDVEHSLANREEAFQSNYAERIPGIGRVVRGSGRAYTRFLVGQRFGIYKHVAQHAEDAGISLDAVGKNGQTVGEQIADLASAATGRGQGRRNGFFERNAVELNAALFSPRLIKSRFDFLNPLAYHRLDPVVRVEKMKMAAKTAVAISTFLYAMSKVPGVKVQADPRSTDFGKIRIGNTRIDVAGGFNQYIRFVAQEVSNGSIDVNTGDIKHGQGIAILNRFWRSKLSPPAGLGTSLVFRSNYAGQPIDPTSADFWKQQAGNLGTPLAGQDAKGVLDATHSWPKAVGAYGIGSIGAGVQNYGPPAPTGKTPEDLRNDLRANVRHYFKRGLTPQLKEALKLRETRDTYMKKVLPKRPGRGATEEEKAAYTLHRFNAQVDLMVKLGKINRGQARKAKSWARSQDRHKVNSETSRVGRKYFGGAALSDATKKIREKGGHLYLGDY